MKLQFLGHACFLLDDGIHKVLTDPFLTGAGRPEWAEKVDPDVIFVTHGHGDHVGDAAAIARRTGAPVCCTADLADAVFVPAGVACVAGNLGGTVRLSFGCAKFFQALHGGGAAAVLPAASFLRWGQEDLSRRRHGPDDRYDPAGRRGHRRGAAAHRRFLHHGPGGCPPGSEADPAPTDGPMHYNTFQAITQDPEAFAARLQRGGICRQSPSAGRGDDPVSSLGRERAEHHSGCPGTGE